VAFSLGGASRRAFRGNRRVTPAVAAKIAHTTTPKFGAGLPTHPVAFEAFVVGANNAPSR
jgi:hypothetical protein